MNFPVAFSAANDHFDKRVNRAIVGKECVEDRGKQKQTAVGVGRFAEGQCDFHTSGEAMRTSRDTPRDSIGTCRDRDQSFDFLHERGRVGEVIKSEDFAESVRSIGVIGQ